MYAADVDQLSFENPMPYGKIMKISNGHHLPLCVIECRNIHYSVFKGKVTYEKPMQAKTNCIVQVTQPFP